MLPAFVFEDYVNCEFLAVPRQIRVFQDGVPDAIHLQGTALCGPGTFLLCVFHWHNILQQVAHEGEM